MNLRVSGSGLKLPTDPYIDPSTGILRNIPGAQTAEQLAVIEADLTASRTIQIQTNNLVAHTRDLKELKTLHLHIFQDIFEWAGEIRNIDMRRGGGKFFAPKEMLEINAFNVFQEFRKQNYLKGLNREEFIAGLSIFYDQLNFIHPFREGNGRTQRLFWSRVSLDAGWILDWRPIHGEKLNEVSRAAREDGNIKILEQALSLCVEPVTS